MDYITFYPDPKSLPLDFSSSCVGVHCVMQINYGIVLLKRSSNLSFGDMWNSVCGTIEENETTHGAIVREIEEETNLKISLEQLTCYGNIFSRNYEEGKDYVHCIFGVKLNNFTLFDKITLNEESTEKRLLAYDEIVAEWCDFLMPGQQMVLERFASRQGQLHLQASR